MSLPYRFKAGASTMSVSGHAQAAQHHHRSTTKADHKPFKGRHASNRQLKAQAKVPLTQGAGKVEDRGRRRPPFPQAMSKLARKNQAKQLRQRLGQLQDREAQIFHGPDAAPKHVAVVPLTPSVDVAAAIARLSQSVDATAPNDANPNTVRVERFRRTLRFIPAPFDLLGAIDVCKLADWVVFVLAPDQAYDEQTDTLLRAIEGQGMTSFTAVVENVDSALPSAKRSRHLVDLKAALGHYLPALDKLASLDSTADCANLVRSLCTAATKGIRWRDDRSWMLIDSLVHPEPSPAHDSPDAPPTATVTITGIVRGQPLNPDRLVHVPGWGDFRVAAVRQILPQSHKRKADEMEVEEAPPAPTEWVPTADQDDLAELAPETVDMADAASTVATTEHKGVLLDDHHYFSDDDSHMPPPPKKLPKGTSAYQAAWYLDDVSDSDSDAEDDDGDLNMQDDGVQRPEDGFVAHGDGDQTEAGPSEYPESEAHVDADAEEEARQLEDFRASRKREAEEDLEFPDEIELHPEALARERLAKYRGLKSLRTSEWNTAEDAPYEPDEHKRLLHVPDYKKSCNAAKKEVLAGPIPAGTRVEIDLSEVPLSLAAGASPSALFSLLRHEHKHTVVNLSLTLRSDVEAPVRSKEELLVQIGHRRLLINPVFSAPGQTPNDVHKFDRFLHPGRTAIASFQGPITWGSTPVLVFKRQLPSADEVPDLVDTMEDTPGPKSVLKLVGSATTMPSSPSRVIAKRVILTGHPYKIHKKLVTVRYMFFNRQDVAWFAALPLWTKRGRQGFVKEPLGTHGYFKATFDGRINPLDAIGVSLYKRIWPRPARSYDA
ncbi:hypothetical protein DV735_g3343, partial [Chaetothyriales sp. CBS 134920]